MKIHGITLTLLLLIMSHNIFLYAQKNINYDESKVPNYTLPDPLIFQNGEKVGDAEDWHARRPQVFELFEQEVYGMIPGNMDISRYQIVEQGPALNKRAWRKQVKLIFEKEDRELQVLVLIYIPMDTENPPLFLGYNFFGNHTTTDDPKVLITKSWTRNDPKLDVVENRATETSRGKLSARWDLEKIIASGFGLATLYCGDIDPDRNDFSDGIHPFFYKDGQTAPFPHEWGTLSAWAWGLTKVLDYFENDQQLVHSPVIVMGHSRLGKAALWAGALDQRFDMVISNNSGCGGAALSRRRYGETVAVINKNFPHWFAQNFHQYNHKEEELPVDQHMLLALMAPRPLYIASAENDRWADPKGEFLSAVHATRVYELFHKTGLAQNQHPPVDQPIHNNIGYHIRSGDHDVTDYDWDQYIKWALRMLGDKP